MAIWQVQLSGKPIDLKQLARIFTTPEAEVVMQANEYFVRSGEFSTLDDSTNVANVARRIVQHMNGIASVYSPDFEPVIPGATVRLNDDGSRHIFVAVSMSAKSRTSAYAEVVHGNGSADPPTRPLGGVLLSVVERTPELARALRLFSEGDRGWVNLYRVFEIARGNCGGEQAVVANGWATKTELERFRRTGGHPGTAGDDARHGFTTQEPPPNPMEIKDAVTLVRRLLAEWLARELRSSSDGTNEGC